MKTHYEMYVEHTDGWEFQGTCPAGSVMLLTQLYGSKSDTRLLFIDTLLPRPLAPVQKFEAYVKGWLNFDIDNVEHVLIKSMFNGFPNVMIIPRKEILDGFKLDGLELSGYSRTSTAS